MIDKEKFDEFVSKVRDHSDIFSVVSRYVSLKSKGNQYWGCCPFHSEKTPSFTVSPEKGFFYCFGCHVGGNVFKFISLIESISYFDAIRLQAERLGIEMPKSQKNKSSEQIKKEEHEKILITINTLAKDFFHNCLIKTSYGEPGRKYLESRGINKETIEEFVLGFAPDSWDALSKALVNKKNMKNEQLVAAGVSKFRKNGSGIYDNFRNRVMIPITDLYGQVVAFGGRIIDDKSNTIEDIEKQSNFEVPKYLNSPETLIFNKKNLLFGLNRATQDIRRLGYVIVVEGYMDVISVYSAGIKNVVASLGTAFTEEQAKLLTRYTRKIYFCYDSDNAGQKATMRALPMILKENASAKVIVIPDGKDPDEYIQHHGVDEFKKLINAALPIIDYQIDYILKSNERSTLEGRVNTLKQLIPILGSIQDVTVQGEYRKSISRILLISEDTINSEIRIYKRNNITTSVQLEEPSKKIIKYEDLKHLRAERIVIKELWLENDIINYISKKFPKEIFTPVHQEIIEYIEKCIKQQKRPDDISAKDELSEQAFTEISKLLLENESNSAQESMQAYKDSINVLTLKHLKSCYAKLLDSIKNITINNPNYAKSPDYLKKMSQSLELKRKINKLNTILRTDRGGAL